VRAFMTTMITARSWERPKITWEYRLRSAGRSDKKITLYQRPSTTFNGSR